MWVLSAAGLLLYFVSHQLLQDQIQEVQRATLEKLVGSMAFPWWAFLVEHRSFLSNLVSAEAYSKHGLSLPYHVQSKCISDWDSPPKL